MSHSDPRTLKEELRIRVVALLTGELSEADADELEKILTVDTELADYRDRMAVLIGHVHDAREEIAPALHNMRLSDERRAEIFKDIDLTQLETEIEPPKKIVSWQMRVLEWAAVIAVLFILAGIFIPTVGAVKKQASSTPRVEEAEFEAATVENSSSVEDIFMVFGMTPQEANIPESEELPLVGALFRNDKAKENDQYKSGSSVQTAEYFQHPNASDSLADNSADLRAVATTTTTPHGASRQDYRSEMNADIAERDWAFNVDGDELRDSEMANASGSLGLEVDGLAMDARAGGSYSGYAGPGGPVDPFAAPSMRPSITSTRPQPEPAPPSSEMFSGKKTDQRRFEDTSDFDGDMSGPVDAFASYSAPAMKPAAPQKSIQVGIVGRSTTAKQAPNVDPFAAPASGGAHVSYDWDSGAGRNSNTHGDFKQTAGESGKRKDLQSRGMDRNTAALLAEGRAKYLNGDYDGASSMFDEVSSKDPGNAEAKLFAKRIDDIQTDFSTRNDYKTREQILSEVSQSWARPKVFDLPEETVAAGQVNRLKSIVIPKVNFNGMELSQVIDTLSELSIEYDPEHIGVNIVPLFDVNQSNPRVNISLRNLSVDRILEFVTQQVNYSYSVARNAVTVQPAAAMSGIEQYADARAAKVRQTPKQEKHTRDEAVSTFSLNVSDVSFKLAQVALENSRVPNPERIRSEEFLNSFDYRDPTPRVNEAVSLNWEIADLPYAHGRQVVRFSLQTQAAGRNASQPLNLNLLIDNSGSMQRPDRREIMEQSLQSLKDKLQPNDQLSVVLFARQPKLIANANTPQSQQAAIDTALAYRPEGGTNLEAGLEVAYDNARANFDPAASNRVILMTDGAANLGEVNADTLAKQVVEQRKQGIALDAYGIGWDDYNDELLEAITRNGDGRYAFLNSPDQAGEDFSEKLAGSLRVAAADVKVQITWNPERVTTYRQIGYDLHQLKTEDFRDNTVDAAEIGEAESGTALYVVQINQDADAIGRLGTLHVRYRDPATNQYHEQAWPLEMPRELPTLDTASPALRLATASALFAERLAHNPYARNVSFNDLSELTNDLPEAFPTQQRVVDLQNMIHSARILLGDAN